MKICHKINGNSEKLISRENMNQSVLHASNDIQSILSKQSHAARKHNGSTLYDAELPCSM